MDPELIGRAKRGDKEAFTTLVLTFGDRLVRSRLRQEEPRLRPAHRPPAQVTGRDHRPIGKNCELG
jgi:hypothetical protein